MKLLIIAGETALLKHEPKPGAASDKGNKILLTRPDNMNSTMTNDIWCLASAEGNFVSYRIVLKH